MATESSSHLQCSPLSASSAQGDSPASLVAIMQTIVTNAAELLSLDDCVLALLDETRTHLFLRAGARDKAEDGEIALSLFQEVLGDEEQRCEAVVLRGSARDARLRTLDGEARCTLAYLPIFEREQWCGALLASSVAQDAFTPAQLRALTLYADQLMLALHNERQSALVRDANRMKANFLSLVTHELRSPLNTINGYLDLLLEGLAGEITEQQREFMRRARAGSEHLYALLEDLLLASRADAGQLRLNRAPATLAELVTASIDELEVTALDTEVRLVAALPSDLPPLLVDSVRVQQALRNLLINALRFTPAGGHVTISARVQPGVAETKVEVRISDTGIGIAPEYHAAIFERFFQVPRPEGGRTSGQGLGLAIVKLIVELHDGQIRVESAPGKGSTFIFTLQSCPQE